MKIANIALQAKKSSQMLLQLPEEQRNSALQNIAQKISDNKNIVLEANQKDLQRAEESLLSSALKDRLLLNESRIDTLVQTAIDISKQQAVVGSIVCDSIREDGLKIKKQRIPLGVVAMIFESRPNVLVDCACLAIKSGNAIILKGGKEAKYSNQSLYYLINEAIKDYLPIHSVQLVDTREEVSDLLQQVGLVDVIIPRGGENLINYVYENSRVPVIAHFKGLCHMYIDASAKYEVAKELCLNAKVQRPGVCNAIESLLIHKSFGKENTQSLLKALEEKHIDLRVDHEMAKSFGYSEANEEDWHTEYLDNILSVKWVDNLNQAIEHIQKYGTNHTESIVSEDVKSIKIFQNAIDASCISINASTRFNDGGQLGLGAELGISTTKLHAYGPMGAQEMTTTRFIIEGNGHIRR